MQLNFIVMLFFSSTDMIIEPPSIGYQLDSHGRQVPVAFMQGRINGQYITEGLSSAFMFLLGGIGFIALDQVCNFVCTNDAVPAQNGLFLNLKLL